MADHANATKRHQQAMQDRANCRYKLSLAPFSFISVFYSKKWAKLPGKTGLERERCSLHAYVPMTNPFKVRNYPHNQQIICVAVDRIVTHRISVEKRSGLDIDPPNRDHRPHLSYSWGRGHDVQPDLPAVHGTKARAGDGSGPIGTGTQPQQARCLVCAHGGGSIDPGVVVQYLRQMTRSHAALSS
jgi:hypothetical protein